MGKGEGRKRGRKHCDGEETSEYVCAYVGWAEPIRGLTARKLQGGIGQQCLVVFLSSLFEEKSIAL